uniref:Uncharacterized protein LOC111104336 n=1 Tax=Crassostrea virginica TaxID=6565 RepID=A0A8B8ARY3_CRAVI|nr:uncharacterized protein LOC111104336 [Crassostrea virginica]
MRAASLILCLLILHSLTEDIEAKRRWRRFVNRVRRWIGKRDTGTGAEGFPCQFSKWDTNKDGKVDKAEFEAMLKDQENEMTLEKLFMLIDSNEDTFISEEELKQGPLQLAGC